MKKGTRKMSTTMTNQELVLMEIRRAPGSAHDLSVRSGLGEKQVRGAIDGLRARFGYSFIKHNTDGTFSPGRVIMAIPFERGKTYSRRIDIHQVFGGQEQGGICTPKNAPFVFLFTGESGENHGYSDGWRGELFDYTGEGQRGDMEFIRGNKAIRDHAEDGKDLLLFQSLSEKGKYRFLGAFACAGWISKPLPDTTGVIRRGFVFSLVAAGVDDSVELEDREQSNSAASLEDLRAKAYAALKMPKSSPSTARRAYFEWSMAVRLYVWARAAGTCKACLKSAPFRRADGTVYLEAHHTRRVCDGGPDDPRFVGGICPTCHREIHHGAAGTDLNDRLTIRLGSLEEAAGGRRSDL
jgi:5-methylcytosine-specific restriction enzyme A